MRLGVQRELTFCLIDKIGVVRGWRSDLGNMGERRQWFYVSRTDCVRPKGPLPTEGWLMGELVAPRGYDCASVLT